jgi:hypothetical protein
MGMLNHRQQQGGFPVSTKGLVALAVILAFVPVPSLAGDAGSPASGDVSVDAILKAFVAASGGPELAKITTEARRGTLVRGASGQVPLVTIAQAPGRWRYTQTFAWGDEISFICDGETGWVVDTEVTGEMDPRQRSDLQLLLDVQAPLRLRELYPEMTVKGLETIGNVETVAVVATTPEGLVAELVFDRKTGLLQRAGSIYLEDYREVGGVKRPFRVRLGDTQGESHIQMVMQFTDISHGVEVDESLFKKPACVLAAKAPPLYTHRSAVEVGIPALDACVGVYQHPSDSTVTYNVTRQGNHLMIERTGWGMKIEIVPESETDYFMEFLNREFHFVKDAAGGVTRLEIGADRALKAPRVK